MGKHVRPEIYFSERVELGRVVRREKSSSNQNNPQNLRCSSCKSSSTVMAIELTFAPPQINKK